MTSFHRKIIIFTAVNIAVYCMGVFRNVGFSVSDCCLLVGLLVSKRSFLRCLNFSQLFMVYVHMRSHEETCIYLKNKSADSRLR